MYSYARGADGPAKPGAGRENLREGEPPRQGEPARLPAPMFGSARERREGGSCACHSSSDRLQPKCARSQLPFACCDIPSFRRTPTDINIIAANRAYIVNNCCGFVWSNLLGGRSSTHTAGQATPAHRRRLSGVRRLTIRDGIHCRLSLAALAS